MGARSPSDYGDYYAWGELTSKREFYEGTYKFYRSGGKYTKYTNSDGYVELEPEDDAAHVNWGGNRYIPSWTPGTVKGGIIKRSLLFLKIENKLY